MIRTVVLLILAIALLSLLASCFGHRHSWSAWETEDGVTSRSAAEAAILAQYGLSPDAYDLRITLVGAGLSDYGITLN